MNDLGKILMRYKGHDSIEFIIITGYINYEQAMNIFLEFFKMFNSFF